MPDDNGRVTTQQFYEALLSIKDDLDAMEKRIIAQMKEEYVTQKEFTPIQKGVYGIAGLIIVAVVTAIVGLVI